MLALTALLAVSCQVPGISDDDEESTPGPETTPVSEGTPASDATSEVRMSTFTPTVEGATPEGAVTQEAEQEAEQTAAAVTATHEAENPQPAGTPDPNATPVNPMPSLDATGTPANTLAPPMAQLAAGSDRIESTFGSYSWQFADEMESFVKIQAPIMEITDVALTAPAGSQATLEFSGEQYTEPPQEITVEGYLYDETTAIPQTIQGQTADELAFVPEPDDEPVLETTADPQDPSFQLPEEPEHYIFRVEASWGDHPELPEERLYVTYVFNVIVE